MRYTISLRMMIAGQEQKCWLTFNGDGGRRIIADPDEAAQTASAERAKGWLVAAQTSWPHLKPRLSRRGPKAKAQKEQTP